VNVRAAVTRPWSRLHRRGSADAARSSVPYLRGTRLRLTAWYVGILFVLFAIVGVAVYGAFDHVLNNELDSDLRAVAASADRRVTQLRSQAPPSDPLRPVIGLSTTQSGFPAIPSATAAPGALGDQATAPIEDLLPTPVAHPNAAPTAVQGRVNLPAAAEDAAGLGTGYSDRYPDIFVLLLDLTGPKVLSNARGVPAGFPDSPSAIAAQSGRPDLRTVSKGGQSYRIISQLVLDDRGQPVGIVQAGKPLSAPGRQLRDLAFVLVAGGLGALVLAGAGGLVVAGRALRPAREGWQRQQAFVADASHELRTPLSILRADAEVLLRKPEKPVAENRDLVEDIITEADHLNALIGGLLTLARLDAGQLPLRYAQFDARELLDDVAAQSGRLLDGRQIALEVNGPPNVPLRADRDRVLQVLRILVDNAQRYTPAGGRITLTARPLDGRALISVTDTGSGIAPEHLPRVFERFYRADTARTRSEGGTGLGLAIARGIAEAHGGRLSLASVVGEGTTATLELPVGGR
jgi:signal transduction histidine kinase